jgi:hypothetical protein
MFGTGTGLPNAKARELRLENARRHANYMANRKT